MAEIPKHEFSTRETIEALLAKKGITEGKWVLSAKFSFAAVSIATDENEAFPTGLVSLTGLGLVLATSESQGPIVDAAELHGRTARKARTPRSRKQEQK